MLFLLVLGLLNGRAQMTPSTPPNKVWAPRGGSEDWFSPTNWTPVVAPTITDDVGIGGGGPAQINPTGDDGPAVARTVTLGVNSNGLYSAGELDVAATLNITPGAGIDSDGLQVLLRSSLQIEEGGTVNLGTSVVENYGTINIQVDSTLTAGAVLNRSTGVITGGLAFIAPSGGTVTNAGEISGLTFSGASENAGISVTDGPGNITNTSSGKISGTDGIDLEAGGAVANAGTISGTGEIGGTGAGVFLANGGSVTNNAGAKITGVEEGILSSLPFSGDTEETVTPVAKAALAAPAVAVSNSGTISGPTGVEIDNGGQVTNNAGGFIQGTDEDGIVSRPEETLPAPLVVVNSGTIQGAADGIDLAGGGTVTNNAGGTIIGGPENSAVFSTGGPLTFSNAGKIEGAVILGNFANQATLVTGGTIAGDLNLGADAGSTLILDGTGSEAVSQAVSGLITNNGSVIKQGSGTWVVDKSLGNYAGGTTINAGTLTEALSNALGTGGITVNGNTSVLGVSQGVTITNPILLTQGGSIDNAGRVANPLSGLLAGAGGGNVINEATGIINNAAGDAILFSAGGTVMNQAGGLIQSQQGAGVDSLAGTTAIVNSGTISGATGFKLLGAASVTNNLGGIITGTGGLAILSSGGSTKISNAGTINGNVSLANAANIAQLFPGSRINGNLNLGPSAASVLVLDGSGEQAFSQAVSGTTSNAGSLTKQGSGNWIVDVAMNAPVATNILAGVLTVNSSLTSPLVTVQAGGLLKGSGVIIGNVVNVGTLSPGNSPGTLTINGNYTQGAAGTYNVQIFSPQNYSRLIISGHASLDGTLHLTLASGFKLRPGDTFTVLTAGQGISGTFHTISSNSPVSVNYENGVVNVNAVAAATSEIHFSDGTPDSTTALLADSTFYGFGSLSESMALGLDGTGEPTKENAVSVTFDAGEFDIQGQHGQTYTIPIAGGFKLNDRVRLDYEIPLQYLTIENTSLFQAGLTLDLPVKVIVPSPNQPWSWIVTPTVAMAFSGSREFIGGEALTNVLSYQWHGITATYGNYISFFQGDVLTTNDPKFPSGVNQQIMKNGLRFDIPFAKSYIIEAYGIYTQFFQSALIGNYFTLGAELGHHFTWDVEGQHLDLGYLSLGLYSEFGNHYTSGHVQIGSAWRF
jgi:autotransporter-associated beta strand protein